MSPIYLIEGRLDGSIEALERNVTRPPLFGGTASYPTEQAIREAWALSFTLRQISAELNQSDRYTQDQQAALQEKELRRLEEELNAPAAAQREKEHSELNQKIKAEVEVAQSLAEAEVFLKKHADQLKAMVEVETEAQKTNQ